MKTLIAAVLTASTLFASACEWERHTDDWGTEWWELESEEEWGGALKLVCLRDGTPSIQLSSFGHGYRWHDVEYRVGDGPVITQQWNSVGANTQIADLHMMDNRWEFVQALSGGGRLHLRWADYQDRWREMTFADTDGIDRVAETLDRRCRFLSDEPGPDAWAGYAAIGSPSVYIDDVPG